MNSRAAWSGLTALVLSTLVVTVLLQLGSLGERAGSADVVTPTLTPEEKELLARAQETSRAFAAVVKLVKPAVVNIHVERVVTRRVPVVPFGFDDEIWRWFFGEPMPRPREREYRYRQPVAGSGVIVDAAHGYILTNNHVVAGADRITVKLADGRKFDAEIVGTDPPTDLAVIRIKADHLPEARLGDSDTIAVGEWVIAIGNPFGLELTVTSGVVSAKGRANLRTATYEDYIQTDAAINPGNSGGPLVNLKGEVIGINSVILSPTGTFAGYGFAIPSNMAREVMEQLVSKGTVVRGYLGCIVQDLTPEIAEGLGLPRDTKGVAIPQVQPGSAAEKAGLRANDVVIRFNGKRVTSANQLRNLVAQTPPGTRVTLTVLRDGKEVKLTVTVAERPREETLAQGPTGGLEDRLGIQVTDLTDQLARQLGLEPGERGVVVTRVEPGSPAEEAGLRPGDLIKAVRNRPVQDVASFRRLLAQFKDQPRIALLVKNRSGSRFVALRLK